MFNTDTYQANNINNNHKTNKNQIILFGSKTSLENYFSRVLLMNNQFPTFSIDRKGKIYQHFDSDYYSEFFKYCGDNKSKITIVLENNGWLIYDVVNDEYKNWNNEIVTNKKDIFEKEWRFYRYWHKYNNIQLKELANLCNYLFDKHKIKSECFGSNSLEKKINDYEGIVVASNYSNIETEINPSFDFKYFSKNLKL